MFLARYNPWGKTKREQLQSWNNLSFDPQKTDIDEQIDLVLTLGNMLQQDEDVKMEKFIETIPTIIQTHLIIEPNWAEVTKKAKNLKHIIWRCNPLAIAPPIILGAGHKPYRGQQGGRKPYRGSQQRGRGQQNNYRGQYQRSRRQFNSSCGGYYNNNYYGNYRDKGGHGHGGNNYRDHSHR